MFSYELTCTHCGYMWYTNDYTVGKENICDSCEEKIKREHLKELTETSVWDRLNKIEEWIYDRSTDES